MFLFELSLGFTTGTNKNSKFCKYRQTIVIIVFKSFRALLMLLLENRTVRQCVSSATTFHPILILSLDDSTVAHSKYPRPVSFAIGVGPFKGVACRKGGFLGTHRFSINVISFINLTVRRDSFIPTAKVAVGEISSYTETIRPEQFSLSVQHVVNKSPFCALSIT